MSREQATSPAERTDPAVRTIQPHLLRWTAVAVAAVAFIIYLITMNRTFGFIDKGELVAVASTLGVAHPTGYPTIMLLGYLFTKLLPMRPVLTLNAMAALFTAIGAGVLTILLDDLLARALRSRALKPGPKKGTKGKNGEATISTTPEEMTPATRAICAGFSALFVAFTATWWDQGNGFEVYSLHAVMMPLVTILFLRFMDEEATLDRVNPAARMTRRGFWFALMLGLSFTNHMSTILLAPAFLLYYAWTAITLRNDPATPGARHYLAPRLRRLLFLGGPFLLGLLPYVLLPIISSMGPRFNWGNTHTAKGFWDHITGKIYQVYMFDNLTTFQQQSRYFFSRLPAEMAYAGLVVVLAGIVILAIRNVKLSVLVLLLFLACIFYSGWYDIMEIGPYYMTAIFALGIWFAIGLGAIHRLAGAPITIGLAALLAMGNCAINYADGDESRNTLVEDMTVNVLQTLPQNAIIFSSQWDFWVSGSFYMQVVEGLRPDVMVIDPELLRRSWYLDDMTRAYPEFMRGVKPAVDRFREEVYKFDNDLPYQADIIQSTYIGMMNAMIDSNISRRPVCVAGEVDPAVGARWVRTPYYLSLRLMPDTTYLPQEFPHYRFAFWPGHVDGYVSKIYELYARSAVARLLYEAQHNRNDLAQRYYDLAMSFDPGFAVRDIPGLPLNSTDQVTGMIGFFDQIRAMRPQVPGR
ncbi:MAG: hypothetical protein JWQ98_215 [Chlorobi bacterium]|nr:hypothetical protein [Chlorobiota bacterium]